jgi:o-succinylbenzoate synthase
MKMLDLQWKAYRIPFRDAFLTAHGTLTERTGLLVRVQTDAGYQGQGEIAPLPEFSGASLTDVLHALPALVAELYGRELSEILQFLEIQGQEQLLPAPLLYGLETALLDAVGQASEQSLAALLADGYSDQKQTPSVLRTTIPVNAVIGGATTEMVVRQALEACAAGFTCLKLKVTDATYATIEQVAALRTALGSAPRLRLDANEGWSFAKARFMLEACAEYDIEYVEQPLPAQNIADLARLRRLSPIPLAVDEAVGSLANARHILQMEAADVLILKPQLLGSLRACCQLIQEAQQQQIACVITSTLEAGIGVTAALHLAAASPQITLACGLATLDLLVDNLLQEPLVLSAGRLQLPTGAGLGVRAVRA